MTRVILHVKRIQAGRKLITRDQIAKRAGVSTGTVSNILNGKQNVSEKSVEKVRRAIKELGYIPDQNARSLAGKTNRHIGIAIYEYENPYHWEIIRGIEEYAASKGYFVSEFLLDNKNLCKYDEICGRKLGALVNFMTNEYPDGFLDVLRIQNVKLINFDSSVGPVFSMDYTRSFEEIFRKLSEDGHQKVGYVWSGDELRFNADGRGKLFYELRRRYGMDLSADLVEYNYDSRLLSYDIGYRGCKNLIARHGDLTALFTTNDLVAIGAIRALKDEGKSVPEDVCVVGCDDIKVASNYIPSITSMGFDKHRFGVNIARCIIDGEPTDPSEYVVSPEAVFRESTMKKEKVKI